MPSLNQPSPLQNPLTSSPQKPKILLLTDWFAPGYKAGGPIRSSVNFAHIMARDFEIYVVTKDTDLGSTEAYDGLESNRWLDFTEKVKVWYFSDKQLNSHALFVLIENIKPDFIYINSMFSLPFTIWPLWMKWRKKITASIILAPRGMLRASALQFKSGKKKGFLWLLKRMKLHKKIRFQATDEQEAQDIYRIFGRESNCLIAPNLPEIEPSPLGPIQKQKKTLKLVYIARIHPVKNLLFFLRVLKELPLSLSFDIYGPVEDPAYWEICKTAMTQIASHIQISYRGELKPRAVKETLKSYHIMVLPTQGENFGHSIFESLSMGRPVLISDQTIWRNLREKQIGWDLPLDFIDDFRKAVTEAWEMDNATFQRWSEASVNFTLSYIQDSKLTARYLKLFS